MLNKSIMILISVFLLSSCSSTKPRSGGSDWDSNKKIKNLEAILNQAEGKATPEGKTILKTSRTMIAQKKIVVGSCWDYINAVFNRANYPANKRVIALKSKMGGPFADIDELLPGDWLYFINYSYKEVDHSGIFIEWVDKGEKRAVVMSYQGGKHKKPATYKMYDLKNVYYIIRPKT